MGMGAFVYNQMHVQAGFTGDHIITRWWLIYSVNPQKDGANKIYLLFLSNVCLASLSTDVDHQSLSALCQFFLPTKVKEAQNNTIPVDH